MVSTINKDFFELLVFHAFYFQTIKIIIWYLPKPFKGFYIKQTYVTQAKAEIFFLYSVVKRENGSTNELICLRKVIVQVSENISVMPNVRDFLFFFIFRKITFQKLRLFLKESVIFEPGFQTFSKHISTNFINMYNI